MPPLFESRNLSKNYISSNQPLEILADVNLTVNQGEKVAIIGTSGTGKTTLLHLFGGLARPSSGAILFSGKDISGKNDEELAAFRNKAIGFVFQFHHLLPEFSALENTIMPALINGKTAQETHEQGIALLEEVGLGHRINHLVTLLSGGEQQRVALARALIMEPDLLLADEPTGNLDPESGASIFELISSLNHSRGLATIMVTHNHQIAGQMDRCYILNQGILTETTL